MNTKLPRNVDTVKDISLLELQFSRLRTLGLTIEQNLKIVIMISFCAKKEEYSAVLALLSTLNEEAATWSFFSVSFIEKQKKTHYNVKRWS